MRALIIIGLCGGSGSGKTTAAAVMRGEGAAVIDTDRVYRELCVPGSPCLSELCGTFGQGIISEDGSLDRRALGGIVFKDAEARKTLNRITHAYIKEETLRLISAYEKKGYPAVVVDAPLLFESGFDALCDVTVGITADIGLRAERIISRDGISRADAEKRLAAQSKDDELRARCGTIIENDGDADAFARRIREFYLNALKKANRS